ncbi:MAG: GSCFA domain-containing protein, partial [Bacilli bacterium]|nr:GSCFA domain-containing protein [Bacilli bacterium]
AVDEVCKQYGNAYYFPAYEILLDELRDNRFYKEDMLHPTEQAVRYIWERFVDFAIDPKEGPAMKAAAELKQMLQHRPLFPESEAFQKFELLKEKKISELKRDFPRVCINNLSE